MPPSPAEGKSAPVELPALGTMLANRYMLEERIAVGGMATVFRARDTMLDQLVAIKVIHTDNADITASGGRLLSDLRLEAIASMRLSHPNIVRIYNYEKGEHWGFLVMENVVGEDLRAYRNRFPDRRVPIAEALRIGDRALQGLAHAHGLGIIHYDIKPANVMITPAGDIKLCDFGLSALAALAQKGEHVDLVVAGTPQYISPEAINQGHVDHRSDLYSLAATLYDLIVGTPPYGRDPEKAYRGHLLDAPPVSPLLPPALQALIHKALAKKPTDRFESADAMRTQLMAVINSPNSKDSVAEAPKPTPPGGENWLEIEVEVEQNNSPAAKAKAPPPPLVSSAARPPATVPPPPPRDATPGPKALAPPPLPSAAKPAAAPAAAAAPSAAPRTTSSPAAPSGAKAAAPAAASTSQSKGLKMKSLEQAITSNLGVQGAARADPSGNVVDVVGTVDGETLCATVAMCAAPIERATDMTGLGSVTNWFLAGKKAGYYVHREPNGFVVARGDVSKNPESVMKKIVTALDAKS